MYTLLGTFLNHQTHTVGLEFAVLLVNTTNIIYLHFWLLLFFIQNALVVRVPTLPLPCTTVQTSTIAYVIVTAGKGDRGGKDPLKSSPYHFTYIARGKHTSSKLMYAS